MREQRGINANTFKRRSSLPPEELTTSYHQVGSRSGMHPEDQPYMSATRSRSHAPTTATYVEIDEEGEEVSTRPPTRQAPGAMILHHTIGESDKPSSYPAR